MAAVLLAFMSYPFSDGSVSAPPFGVRPCFLYVACSGELTPAPVGGGSPRSVEEYWKWSLRPGGVQLIAQSWSQPYSLAVVPTRFLVGGFRGGNWFITSP